MDALVYLLYKCVSIRSILDFFLRFVYLHRSEFFLIVLEGDGQQSVLCRLRRAVELLLHRVIEAQTIFDHLGLSVVEHSSTRLFHLQFFCEEQLVILLLTLSPLQVHLLHPLSSAATFLGCIHAFLVNSYPCTIAISLPLYALPTFLQRLEPQGLFLPVTILDILNFKQLIHLIP